MRAQSVFTWLAASSAVNSYAFHADLMDAIQRRAINETISRVAAETAVNAKAAPEPQQGGGGGFGGGGGGRGGGGGGRGGGGGNGGGRGGERGGPPGGGFGEGGFGGFGGFPGGGGGPIPGMPIPGMPNIPGIPGGEPPKGPEGKRGGGQGPKGGFPPFMGPGPKRECPPIWGKISKDLVMKYTAGVPGGQCNDFARAAIRIAFHDCASWNLQLGTSAGCDGSLYLAKEYNRRENAGLQNTVPQMGQLAQSYGVGVADFFQFAAAHAVVTCPLGPTVKTFVGRIDRSTGNPEGLIPNPRAPGDELVQLFEEKGISPGELAALLGAHSTSRQFEFDPAKAGVALDTTPGVWDVKYYGEVLTGKAPFILPSDIALSRQTQVGPVFKSFVNDQVGWNKAYSLAMTKMSLMGVERGPLIDCTAMLPPPKERRRTGKF